jgi:hypothetical protein
LLILCSTNDRLIKWVWRQVEWYGQGKDWCALPPPTPEVPKRLARVSAHFPELRCQWLTVQTITRYKLQIHVYIQTVIFVPYREHCVCFSVLEVNWSMFCRNIFAVSLNHETTNLWTKSFFFKVTAFDSYTWQLTLKG